MRLLKSSVRISLKVLLTVSIWISGLLGVMFGLLIVGGEHSSTINVLAFICPVALYIWSLIVSALSLMALILYVSSLFLLGEGATDSATTDPAIKDPSIKDPATSRPQVLSYLGLCIVCWSMTFTLNPPWGLYERFGLRRASINSSPPEIETHNEASHHVSHQSTSSTPVIIQPHLHLMSWNVQRMGELGMHRAPESFDQSVRCIVESIETLDQYHRQPLDILAFQETSNRGLRALETDLSLDCQFIPYHATLRPHTGGLGVCARHDGIWKINYARKVALDGGGEWRALFTEVGLRGQPHVIFNLINLHFLPHNVTPRALSELFQSPRQLLTLLKTLSKTSATQERQARGVLRLIEGYQDPTLIVGDFNAPPRIGAHSLLQQSWTDLWRARGVTAGATRYFAGLIPMRIDYIYAHPEHFQPIEARTLQRGGQCSDHLPVSAHLALLR